MSDLIKDIGATDLNKLNQDLTKAEQFVLSWFHWFSSRQWILIITAFLIGFLSGHVAR
jgi:type II secretory pathway component PulF